MRGFVLGSIGAALICIAGSGGSLAAEAPGMPTMESMSGRWVPDSPDHCAREGGLSFLPNGVVESDFDGVIGTWRYEILADGTVIVSNLVVSPKGKPMSADEQREAEGAVITLKAVDANTFNGSVSGPNVREVDRKGGRLVRCVAAGTPTPHALAGRWIISGRGNCSAEGGIHFLANGVMIWEDSFIQAVGLYTIGPDQTVVVKDLAPSPSKGDALDKEAQGAVLTFRMADANTLDGAATGPNIQGEEKVTLVRCGAVN